MRKNIFYPPVILLLQLLYANNLFAQNAGINTAFPLGKLHIKGSADASQ
jgi:hypothetical protein